MTLKATPISRCLDRRLQIAGYEIPDLLAIFFLLSILNFLFGRTDMKLLLVWGPTALLATLLRLGKRGKPENYLLHWIRFHMRRKSLLAFDDPTEWQSPPRLHEVHSIASRTNRGIP